MNYQYRIPGSVCYIFSRRPSRNECEWLLAAYSTDDEDAYTVEEYPDSYASDDAVLARIASNIRHAAEE